MKTGNERSGCHCGQNRKPWNVRHEKRTIRRYGGVLPVNHAALPRFRYPSVFARQHNAVMSTKASASKAPDRTIKIRLTGLIVKLAQTKTALHICDKRGLETPKNARATEATGTQNQSGATGIFLARQSYRIVSSDNQNVPAMNFPSSLRYPSIEWILARRFAYEFQRG